MFIFGNNLFSRKNTWNKLFIFYNKINYNLKILKQIIIFKKENINIFFNNKLLITYFNIRQTDDGTILPNKQQTLLYFNLNLLLLASPPTLCICIVKMTFLLTAGHNYIHAQGTRFFPSSLSKYIYIHIYFFLYLKGWHLQSQPHQNSHSTKNLRLSDRVKSTFHDLKILLKWSIKFSPFRGWTSMWRIWTWPNCFLITFIAQACSIQHPNRTLRHLCCYYCSTTSYITSLRNQCQILNHFNTLQYSNLQSPTKPHV